jgi:signal peptidase I
MANEKLKQQILQKGFKPVRKTGEFTLLSAPQGVVIWHRNGHLEGFLSNQLSETLNEFNARHILESLVVVGLSVTYFTTDVTIVNGASMEPTYHTGNIIIKSSAAKKVNGLLLAKGTIVKFLSPEGDQCIKRIVGMPGDEITLRACEVYINGKLIDTNNLAHLMKQKIKAMKELKQTKKFDPDFLQTDAETFKLKPNEYFVIGDNRSESVDSRDYGPVHLSSIISVIEK